MNALQLFHDYLVDLDRAPQRLDELRWRFAVELAAECAREAYLAAVPSPGEQRSSEAAQHHLAEVALRSIEYSQAVKTLLGASCPFADEWDGVRLFNAHMARLAESAHQGGSA